MTPELWEFLESYSQEVFGSEDEHLAGLMEEATAAGLPDIAVSADVGRLLQMLTSMTEARLAIEVGTLGGYSAIWIARGLRSGGRLITIEIEERHARFAREQFTRAGVADQVEIRLGAGIEVLDDLAARAGAGERRCALPRCRETRVPRLLPYRQAADRRRRACPRRQRLRDGRRAGSTRATGPTPSTA